MHLLDTLWNCFVSLLSLSPVERSDVEPQAPLLNASHVTNLKPPRGPIFKPPGGRRDGEGSDFQCDYSKMVGWVNCSTPENRGCWLRNPATGAEFNITTDYEFTMPTGITRNYIINITDGAVNADGMNFDEAKLFNSTYPGPWIQACWGDVVNITIQNRLEHNGTSIHWHGIRQNQTMHMDGVNGVTQCPIAPGDNFTYTWTAGQYGSSWYHSHYSVQYADGAVGPMTIHGPSSAPWDEPKSPILMTDWYHNSAFEAIWPNGPGAKFPSILLNSRGNITKVNNKIVAVDPPEIYTIHFDRPPKNGGAKRYLLRLINTSFDSTFVFSIDNHTLHIIGADFVPIHPYKNTSVLVGIGQRYHVIVEANDPEPKANGQYWIRTGKANCFGFNQSIFSDGYNATGILTYRDSTDVPTTKPWPPSSVSLACSDETYTSLKPILKWTVPPMPANDRVNNIGELFDVKPEGRPTIFPLAIFSIGKTGGDNQPLQIDYSNPTFFKLNYTGAWNPPAVIIPENYNSTSWVYMVLRGFRGSRGSVTGGAHPIHLHGHDFAILQQIEQVTFPFKLNFTYDNPPRRDVVLLPINGYVVIAFKTDNPGVWLMHCHIAVHASFGLGLQIMERQADAANIWPSRNKGHALANAQRTCDNWNAWWGNCSNWWHGDNETSCGTGMDEFSPDSGI